MSKTLKSRQAFPSFEIDWKIREIFSEAALSNFYNEVNNKYAAIEKNK